MIVIAYTTRYRDGGPRFAQVAQTLAQRLQAEGNTVVCRAVEDKAAFVELVTGHGTLQALHFVGHAGLYGPMFGTTAWPEQFSPHEWRALSIPFGPGAEAHFHACRSARWFAPFFARTFGVPSSGFHWYTAFSSRPDRYAWVPPWFPPQAPLFVAGCPGRKSHGLLASARKYAGRMPFEAPIRFEPGDADASYDAVASDYDEVFDDIAVRHDELAWIEAHLPTGPFDALDIGCGNGALLQKLSGRLRSGVGVDASAGMITKAVARNGEDDRLRFAAIDGPTLPLPDHSIDVAISLLSFRYLDWDPLMLELRRVLRPTGKLLVVDMVDKPVTLRTAGRLLVDKLRVRRIEAAHPGYRRARKRMVGTSAWRTMLRYNPMRAFHEYDWYLGSRFPRGRLQTLNVGRRARVIAFDTGPFEHASLREMAYP
ncbi:MAG: class I SAM-dependent methyltransferase [Myxococcota bacterium]